jgi:hypothetical protein
MLELYHKAVRVLKQVVHWHRIHRANWIIFCLKYQEWYINIRNKSITMYMNHQDSFDLPGDIPIKTVDRIVPENFGPDKIVEVTN